MSKLDELINKLCPNGVKFYKLCDISTQYNGMTGVSKKWNENGNCHFIDYLNAYNNIKIDVDNRPNATVTKFGQNVIRKGDILCTCASETPDECAISSVVEDEIEKNTFLDDHLFGIRVNSFDKVNPIFLNYYFRSKECRKKINKTVRGVTRFYISNKDFMKIEIPVPPMEVQCEIVRILDNFTELTAEFTAEFTARKQQFYEYTKKLTSFDNCSFTELKATNKLLRGKRLTARDLIEDGKFAVYHGGIDPLGFYDKANRKADTVMIINVGASAGSVGYSKDEFWSSDGCFCIEHSDKYLNKFLYYYFLTKEDYLKSKVRRAGIPTLDNPIVEKILVPQISIEKQKYIVDVLDKFDAYCNDLTQGLPAEIEARKKQYEYYRDKLLTFKRLEN